jgi:hypothetical protein
MGKNEYGGLRVDQRGAGIASLRNLLYASQMGVIGISFLGYLSALQAPF